MKHEKTLAEKAGPVARLDVRERLIAHLPCESWPFGPSVWKTDQIEHRRGLASEIIGPPVRPRDCSSMSISEIVYWVARKGGAVDFEVNDQSKWNAAIAEVLNKTEQLDLTARQSEAAPPDKDVAYLLRDVCVKHPYQNSNEIEIQTETQTHSQARHNRRQATRSALPPLAGEQRLPHRRCHVRGPFDRRGDRRLSTRKS